MRNISLHKLESESCNKWDYMDEQCQLPTPWRYRKVKQACYHKKIIHSLKTVTTWNLLWTQLCHEFHGKDELVLNQLEDWNSRPMSWEHCSNYSGSWDETHSKAYYWLPWIEILILKQKINHDTFILFE